MKRYAALAERMGFEPMVGCPTQHFQCCTLRPLGHLSIKLFGVTYIINRFQRLSITVSFEFPHPPAQVIYLAHRNRKPVVIALHTPTAEQRIIS